MTQINNFAQTRRVLMSYVPPGGIRGSYTLERMHKLMDKLGNPQNDLKIIHVAGTSGKTSTCYYIAALLEAAGQKVGLTVSPHIDEVNERVQINLTPMPEQKFCQELTEFLQIVDTSGIKPTYFELLVAFAYWEFVRQKVDYAVVEVGLGGLLDGTNVISRTDKVCVIADIGLDHTDVLGSSVAAIAAQKAGIIQSHNVAIMHAQNSEVMSVVEQKVHTQNAKLITVGQNKHLSFIDMPYFQRRNWQLALVTYEYVQKRDTLSLLDEEALHATMRTYIPARMEIVESQKKTVVIDGAHNAQKMHVLISSLQKRFPAQQMSVLLSVVDGKDLDVTSLLQELKPITKTLTVTSFGTQQDVPRYSIKPELVAKQAEALGFASVRIIQKPEDAFKQLLAESDDMLLVTGSFYLLNHIRPHIPEIHQTQHYI